MLGPQTRLPRTPPWVWTVPLDSTRSGTPTRLHREAGRCNVCSTEPMSHRKRSVQQSKLRDRRRWINLAMSRLDQFCYHILGWVLEKLVFFERKHKNISKNCLPLANKRRDSYTTTNNTRLVRNPKSGIEDYFRRQIFRLGRPSFTSGPTGHFR